MDDDRNNISRKEAQKEILIVYLKLLRKEMHLRLNKHYNLVIFKLVSVATVSSFLILNSDKVGIFTNINYIFYVLIPLIAIMFDFQIAFNMKWLNTTGTFIRDKVECYFQNEYGVELYETKALGFSAILNRLVEIVITAITVIFGLINIKGFPIQCNYKWLIGLSILLLFLFSSYTLINSRKGHAFNGENK